MQNRKEKDKKSQRNKKYDVCFHLLEMKRKLHPLSLIIVTAYATRMMLIVMLTWKGNFHVASTLNKELQEIKKAEGGKSSLPKRKASKWFSNIKY